MGRVLKWINKAKCERKRRDKKEIKKTWTRKRRCDALVWCDHSECGYSGTVVFSSISSLFISIMIKLLLIAWHRGKIELLGTGCTWFWEGWIMTAAGWYIWRYPLSRQRDPNILKTKDCKQALFLRNDNALLIKRAMQTKNDYFIPIPF